MIIKTFDNGWGDHWPVKQLEQEILKKYLAPLDSIEQQTVVINSTWYTDDYHKTVTSWLQNNTVDIIVLVAMLDAAIPRVEQFTQYGAKIITVGYYPDSTQLDFWALFLDRYFNQIHTLDLCRIDLIDCAFMCLNRKPHAHRIKFYNQLIQLNLIDKGFVSMGSNGNVPALALDCPDVIPLTPNAGIEQNGIPNDIATLGNIDNWQRHFLNIVTETVYGINRNYFVSEKIYKPILGMRPFLVYDTDSADCWLKNRGFEPYTDDFVDITDLDLKNPDNIAPFLTILSEQKSSYWKQKLVDLNQKIVYNKQNFYKYVDQQKTQIDKGITWQA
jgi:hypothetical protein